MEQQIVFGVGSLVQVPPEAPKKPTSVDGLASFFSAGTALAS